jgi:hypothetical protein
VSTYVFEFTPRRRRSHCVELGARDFYIDSDGLVRVPDPSPQERDELHALVMANVIRFRRREP